MGEQNPRIVASPPPAGVGRKIKIIARLMRSGLNKVALAATFDVEIRGRESIFDCLVREGRAENFSRAVELVGRRLPPPSGGRWGELAAWVENYEDHERPEAGGSKASQRHL